MPVFVSFLIGVMVGVLAMYSAWKQRYDMYWMIREKYEALLLERE